MFCVVWFNFGHHSTAIQLKVGSVWNLGVKSALGGVGLASCQSTEMGIEGMHKDEISQRQGADWEKIGTNIGRGTSNDWGKGEPRESSVAKAYIGKSFQGEWALSHANHLELETTCLGDMAHDRDWFDTKSCDC